MQENIIASMPGSTSPKPIQQSDIEQDYDFLLAQKVSEQMMKLGLISLSEFNKITALNRKSFSPALAQIMPENR